MIVLGNSEAVNSEEFEDAARVNRRHVAALLVEPFGVAAFGNAVLMNARRGAQRAISWFESTGMSPGVLLPNVAWDAPYFIKFPAIQ